MTGIGHGDPLPLPSLGGFATLAHVLALYTSQPFTSSTKLLAEIPPPGTRPLGNGELTVLESLRICTWSLALLLNTRIAWPSNKVGIPVLENALACSKASVFCQDFPPSCVT